jgi:hypothetical protein
VRKQKLLVAALALGALGLSAVLLIGYRVELFVLPARLEEVLRLQALREGAIGPEEAGQAVQGLESAATELIRLQRPDFAGGHAFRIEEMRTLEGKQAFLITYFSFEPSPWGWIRRFHVVDSRGRIFGDDFPDAIYHGNSGYCLKANVLPGSSDILLIKEWPEYSFSVDREGIVPRGAVPDSTWSAMSEVPRLSRGSTLSMRRWFEMLGPPPADAGRIERWLESPHLGDLFRALHGIERLGPKASRLARPLLGHPDPEIRARAVAVLGNDESLWRDILPLASDPSPFVSATARLALLRAPDITAARGAFIDSLRSNRSIYILDEVPFDFPRLLSQEVCEAILDWGKDQSYLPDTFLKVAAADLRPLLPWIEEQLSKRRSYLVVHWAVLCEDPRLDGRLVEMLEEGRLDESGGSTYVILSALLDRPSPIAGEAAVEAVRRCSETDDSDDGASLAFLVLLHWKVPGTVEKLLAKLREPDNDWLRERIWDEHPFPEMVPVLEVLAEEEPDRFRVRADALIESLKKK